MPIFTSPDSYTKLLMHADDVNGSTTFTDHSNSNHTITRDAVVDHDSGNKIFGASGIYIPKANRLQIADSTDWQFEEGDFTIDLWAKYWSTTDTAGLFTYYKDANNRYHLTNYSNLDFYSVRASSSQNASVSHARDLLWHHYAVVRYGDNLSIYVDGIKKVENTSYTLDIDFTGGTFYIGTRTDNGSDFSTYSNIISIDEFRVSKGVARWTSDFLPPTRPYSKIDDDFMSDQEGLTTNQSTRHIGTGGTISYDGNYRIHTFTSSGTFATKSTVIADILSIGGGGGGGSSSSSYGGGGGGGAGGFVYKTGIRMGAGNQTVTVGTGGAGGGAGSSQVGANGGNSEFAGLPEDNAIGGGGGGAGGTSNSRMGNNGGSGGGAGYNGYNNVTNTSTGTSTQGHDGANVSGDSASGSGGGGAGGVGAENTGSGGGTGGAGGAGKESFITGASKWYAIGGAGGETNQAQAGANTGGGGNGAYATQTPQAGADGVVIIRYQI